MNRGSTVRRATLAEIVLVLGLAVLAVVVLRQQALRQVFSVDESRWIATSRYFWVTFVDRDLFGEAWQPGYVVFTHPPVARYVIGFGLWLQGWTPDQLNGRYDSDVSREANRRAGNIPSRPLVEAARRVTLVFAAGSVLLLYLVGRLVAGPVAGAAAAGLALANPLLATIWTRALAESILAFFCLLTVVLAIRFGRSNGRENLGYGWPVALGVSVGLATATKLSGALIGFGLGLFAVGRYGARWWRERRLRGPGLWLDAAMAAFLTFVLVNPLLYPNPAVRAVMLFEHRRDEMEVQALNTPRLAVPNDPLVRAGLLYRRTFLDYGTLQARIGMPLDAPLALAGLGVAVLAAWRRARDGEPAAAPLLLVCCTASVYVVSTLTLGFDSAHYVALPVMLAVLLEGVALAALVAGLLAGLVRLRRRRISRAAARAA